MSDANAGRKAGVCITHQIVTSIGTGWHRHRLNFRYPAAASSLQQPIGTFNKHVVTK